ncbi:signal peptidase II [Lentzea albidocapillata subsp. violacea]|uniref:Lipoprotein signal peptidase n=1 Tax=Lentzea albidocapillata subsp. violacea TaxID=128104 RepID=A0A1G9MTV0_9PSEU|nr:signal peptidase II [Lentzea albidocapillata]SDL77639.1 signal peptidase II [Lentzea albidocapillata subsp. violacea]
MSDESKAEEKASGMVADVPAEAQVSEPETVAIVVEEPAAESPAKVEDDDEFPISGSISGSLPEPRTKILAILAAGVLALDVVTKVVSVAFLEGADPIKLFGGVLYLTFVRNPGAAFGLAESMTWILALIAFGVAGFIVWISRNLRSQGWAVGLGLVLGGAIGNLADRLFRTPGPMRGHVVDFLSLFDPYGQVWPVFNVADMAIVCGGVTIIILALLQHDYDGTVHKRTEPLPEQDGLQESK